MLNSSFDTPTRVGVSLNNRLKFSVITICRNSSKTITNTIESVITQHFDGILEYIIVDGASTDGTQDIIHSFGGSIDKFVSEPDSGISEAFNKGLSMATGDIIGIINSDDAFLAGTLEKVLLYYSKHPCADVVHGDVLLYQGDIFVKRIIPPKFWWVPWRLIVFNHPATFVRRRVYEKCGGFDSRYRYAMDIDLYLRWVRSGLTIGYLGEPLARMLAGGIGGQNAFAAFAEGRRVMIENGFSPAMASVQYLGRCGVQLILNAKSNLEKLIRS